MIPRALPCIVAALLLAACSSDDGPPIVISNVRVLAPLPGSTMGVAYMNIENRGDAAVVIGQVISPQFDAIEIHETTIEEGVAKMQALDEVTIEPGSTLVFDAAGKHFMLMGAGPNTVPGSPVTLEIHHDSGLLVVSATMQSRLPSQ